MALKVAQPSASDCALSSAAALPEGAIRRRRRSGGGALSKQQSAGQEEARADAVEAEDAMESAQGADHEEGLRAATQDGFAENKGPNKKEAAADMPEQRTSPNRGRAATADTTDNCRDRQSKPASDLPRQATSRLLIQLTPRILKFLEQRVPQKTRKEFANADRIDLDVLQRLVLAANKEKHRPKVNMADLVEESHVVERIEAPQVPLDKLSFSERLRLKADERRHQAAVRSLWGDRGDRGDCFADINKSLAMGVNALLGIFLTFLGGYWAALYCGVESFQSVRRTADTRGHHRLLSVSLHSLHVLYRLNSLRVKSTKGIGP